MQRSNLYLFSVLFFFIIGNAYSQSTYFILWDNTLSEKVGAENLLTLHKAVYSAEENILPSRPFGSADNPNKFTNASYRFIKSFALDYPLDYITGEIQHEAFGHGARFREFNWTNMSYHVSLPPPYGDGHGFATGMPPNNLKADENQCMIFSGVEGERILAESMQTKWMLSDSVNYRDFFLYAGSFHNLTTYIYQTQWKLDHNQSIIGGNDMNNYMNNINYKYANLILQGTKRYKFYDLGNYAAVNFFDPFVYLGAWQWLKYIVSGEEKGKLPMMAVGKFRYLPSVNLALTPFGAEFYMHHFLKVHNRLFELYGRYGDPRFVQFYGFGARAYNLIHSSLLNIDIHADGWNQPSLNLQDQKSYVPRKTTAGFGASVSASVSLKLFGRASLVFQPGYKTDGFLEGETLSQGFYARFGIGIKGF